MFGQVPPTEFDLRFSLFRVPIRVHPIFWLTSAFLAWMPGEIDKVLVGVLCVFVGILVHELGHALVTRRFGWQPEIVLYIMGGYATTMRHSTWRDIAVSAAGPLAGLLLFAANLLIFLALTNWTADPLHVIEKLIVHWYRVFRLGQDLSNANDLVIHAVSFSLFINLMWNLMNLIPVHPLDGGQICRELCLYFKPRRGMELCLKISMVVAGSVAVLAFVRKSHNLGILGLDPLFLGIFFAWFCYQNFQDLQNWQRGGWR